MLLLVCLMMTYTCVKFEQHPLSNSGDHSLILGLLQTTNVASGRLSVNLITTFYLEFNPWLAADDISHLAYADSAAPDQPVHPGSLI